MTSSHEHRRRYTCFLACTAALLLVAGAPALTPWARADADNSPAAGTPGEDVEPQAGDAKPAAAAAGEAAGVFWTYRAEGIFRANADGTGVKRVRGGLAGADGLAVDAAAGKVYWTLNHPDAGGGRAPGKDKVPRANLDGTGEVETLVDGQTWLGDVAVDPKAGKMYWSSLADGKIYRAGLDGKGVEVFIADQQWPDELALDPANGHVYWGDAKAGTVSRADLRDGANPNVLLSDLPTPVFGIALDPGRKKIYCALWGAGQIIRANLDRTGAEVLLRDLNRPDGVALDLAAGRLYWTEEGRIGRADLDGKGPEQFADGKSAEFGSIVAAPAGGSGDRKARCGVEAPPAPTSDL